VRLMESAKRPVTALAGAYGHPVHPALVALPIGAWVASVVFDVASLLVSDGRFLVEGARWLIALGVLGAVVAALAGFLDLVAIPGGTRAFRIAIAHMSVNLVVTALFGVGFALRAGSTDQEQVGWGPLALSAVALAGLAVGGWLGGTLAFRYGVRVADEATQREGYHRPGSTEEEA
jgi:uncharacterized membrane protein